MPEHLAVTLISCSCLALLLPVIHSLLKAYNAPLRGVPGPWLARFTSIWLIKAISSRDYHKINIRLHQKHGAVVRIAPNEYSIDDLEASKIIYRSRDQLVKAPWYSVWGLPNVEPSTFSSLNVEHHYRRRKQIASLYQTSAIADIEHQVDGVTKTFLEKMAVFSRQGTTFDLTQFLQFYAFDAIGVLAFGKPFGFLQKEIDIAGVMATLHGFSRYAAAIGVISEWHPVVWRFLQLLTFTEAAGIAHIYRFIDEAIAEWHQRSQDRSVSEQKNQAEEPLGTDFLSSLLSKHKENPAAFSIDDVYYHIVPNVSAGGETTGISLSATVYFLCQNPEKLRKLRSELQITGLEKARDCLYLQAVIKESLRLFPATGLSLPRVVPEGGLTLAGHFFPGGTVVGVNSWVAHANCSIFGQDAASFRPERWLGNEALVNRMEQYFFAFGHGPRSCLGKNISLMEMSKLIPELVLRFDISFANPNHDWTVYNDWFVLQKDFRVRLSERKH